MKDIPREVLTRISTGQEPTLTLVEILAADFNMLLAAVCPKTSKAFPTLFTREDGEPMGVVERMKVTGQALHEVHGRKGIANFASHPSDIVRGWATYMIGCIPGLEIQEYLRHIRPSPEMIYQTSSTVRWATASDTCPGGKVKWAMEPRSPLANMRTSLPSGASTS